MRQDNPYLSALDATWPAAEICEVGDWHLRRGAGGGKRVSAASGTGDVEKAVTAMAEWGQVPLFQLWPGDEALDAELAARGYSVVDPVNIYAAPVAPLVDERSEVARILRLSSPIALAEDMWRDGGIGAERLAVMARAKGAKAYMMARLGDRPAAVGFAATAGAIAMVHAIETIPAQRRKGAGRMIVQAAARFARDEGAETLALAVTKANTAANALYQSLGMTVVSEYHYRQGPNP
ncbi:MAG: GNAT family N-acetyltransferase [Pikeienuella sp.]